MTLSPRPSLAVDIGRRAVLFGTRKVDVRLPGKVNSGSHDARPVHLITTMVKWIRTSRLSIKNSLFLLFGSCDALPSDRGSPAPKSKQPVPHGTLLSLHLLGPTLPSEVGTNKIVKARFYPRLEPFPVRNFLQSFETFPHRSIAVRWSGMAQFFEARGVRKANEPPVDLAVT